MDMQSRNSVPAVLSRSPEPQTDFYALIPLQRTVVC
uniref:Uncharacterized protein n=1 Tax=Rhizophora mucronata TaxID=61149 RepID=A0A2P2JJ19_RHIMU